MSTKSSIKYGDGYHLYHEGLDNWGVYLRLENTEFEAKQNQLMSGMQTTVTVRIPIHIWKEIRQHIDHMEPYLDMSPEQLRAEAEKKVDEHRAWLEEKPDGGLRQLAGVLTYGLPESSREEMIENWIRAYTPPERSNLEKASEEKD